MPSLVSAEQTHNADFRGACRETAATAPLPQRDRGLDDLARRLIRFHERFYAFFVTRTRSVIEQSKKYLLGLIQSEKRNMERMAEVVPDGDDQVYQHFMSQSPWSHRAVLDQVANDADVMFGDSDDCFMVIDESGFAKKGKKSVGVARQWNGRLGKIDNCQVGAYIPQSGLRVLGNFWGPMVAPARPSLAQLLWGGVGADDLGKHQAGEPQGCKIELVNLGELSGQPASLTQLEHLDALELGGHHEGRGSGRGFIVPTGQLGLVLFQVLAHAQFDEAPQEQ